MSTTGAKELTEDEYHSLLAHASVQSDFFHLGGISGAKGSGDFAGFACLAETECKQTLKSECSFAEAQQSIESVEQASNHYQVKREQTHEYLVGGWVGTVSFEFGYLLEERLSAVRRTLPDPILSANLYLWMASYNQKTGKYYLWLHPECSAEKIAKLEYWLKTSSAPASSNWEITAPFRPRQTATRYKTNVDKVKRYIQAGDCYQVNLSQEFEGRYKGNSWNAYKALTKTHPTPFSAFIRQGAADILSVSPERFLSISQNIMSTSPIKGTRARGRTTTEDRALAEELINSEKDRAENLMIVDLLRNDLGLHAEPGTVKVEGLFELESFHNVHHLVSHIKATLRSDVTPFRAFLAAFPGGSITGAPKIRAMEIIRELEPHWRGPYCGSVFYMGLNGRLDSNIAIRTLFCRSDGTIRCWGGGGIVADSEPESEYQETLTKVKPLMDFLEKLNQGD
ncbi:MAG: aminodeoxychorismate synthase component I [Marinobacter sp.]|nr:aminodeoxychorismate synthase component I [Marinobacter sp.]